MWKYPICRFFPCLVLAFDLLDCLLERGGKVRNIHLESKRLYREAGRQKVRRMKAEVLGLKER